MDREQEELQFLGSFGIYKKSINIISKWSKILIKLTLSLIFPFFIIFQAKIQSSKLLAAKIKHNEHILDFTQEETTTYNKIANLITFDTILNFVVKAAFIFFFILFSLPPTIAVVSTVVNIFTGEKLFCMKYMKRIYATFLWCFTFAFSYHFLTFLFFTIWEISYKGADVEILFIVFMLMIYLLGLFCTSIFLLLAIFVSISADIYGIQAMVESKALISGDTGTCAVHWLCLLIFSTGIVYLFDNSVLQNGRIGIGGKFGYGALCVFILSLYHYLSFKVQKALFAHLDVHLRKYVPPTPNVEETERIMEV